MFVKKLEQYSELLAVADRLKNQRGDLVKLAIQIQQIPAPTNYEEARAAWIVDYLCDLDIATVYQDELHNIYAHIPGKDSQQSLMVSAHTDTVFPMETDLTVRHDPDQQRVYGPGIGDNSTGVAALLALARELQTLDTPPVDIWLVANSREEGLGDLRGMRRAIDHLESVTKGRLGAAIVIEGMGIGRIVHRALGSRRFRIKASAPGGHSWSNFGSGSATHALVQLASELTTLKPPTDPRTTFNIGRIEGGTSINTIAQHAYLDLDLRSESPTALAAIVAQVEFIVAKYQTEAWQSQGIKVETELIGDRPTGAIAADHPLVKAAHEALLASDVTHRHELQISSTDANIPLSCDIPAVCVGMTEGGDAHRLTEWIDPTLLPQGVAHLLLLSWWTADWLGNSG